MSQRYIFLKMASYKDLRDEGYPSSSSQPTRRRLSSASLPSTRSTRAPSLRHFRATPPRDETRVVTPIANKTSSMMMSSPARLYGDDKRRKLDDADDTDTEPQTEMDFDDVIPEEYDDGNDDTDMTRCRLSKEVMFIVAALIVLVTSGGLILGFGPIYSVLVQEHQWSELCTGDSSDSTSTSTTCANQEVRLQYVFSTGFLCLSIANAFFGVFLDVAGPRCTALMGLTMSAVGNFLLAAGDSHTGQGAWIIAGYSLLGAGGMGSYLAAFQILHLFEEQGFVCSALSSLFNCSGYIYMLLQVQGIHRAYFFQVYGVLVVACMVICFLIFPTNNIMRPRDSIAIPAFRLEAPRFLNPFGLMEGVREELKRPDLWFFAIYFGWISLIFAFAGGAIPSILGNLAHGDMFAASLYINYLYPVLVNGTFIYSPLVGYVIDHYGFKVIFVAGLVLVQAFIAVMLVPSLHLQLVMFFLYAMAQACIYALQFAYIMMCFPPELYGTLQAIMAMISFLFGLLNYLLNPWTQMYLDGDYTLVLLLLAVPTVALYFFIYVVKGCEDQTIKYDAQGNPIVVTIQVDDMMDMSVKTPTERTKLLV